MTGEQSRSGPRGAGDGCRLILFVAGEERNSMIARRNLDQLQQDDLGAGCHVDVVDVFEDLAAAIEYSVLLTPCLVVERNGVRSHVVGNLSDLERVRAALDLQPGGKEPHG